MLMKWSPGFLKAVDVLIETDRVLVQRPITTVAKDAGISVQLTKLARKRITADPILLGKIQKLNRQYKRKLHEVTEELR